MGARCALPRSVHGLPMTLIDHWDLFRQYVEKPPERRLELIAEINVGCLQELGRSHTPCIELTVEPRSETWNPAHAEIPPERTPNELKTVWFGSAQVRLIPQ